MYAITYRCPAEQSRGHYASELRHFFRRLEQVRSFLGREPYLNRLQRRRCRNNLVQLQALEREFLSIEYAEDYLELHRRLRRYLYLDSCDLARVLGSESIPSVSLFLPAI